MKKIIIPSPDGAIALRVSSDGVVTRRVAAPPDIPYLYITSSLSSSTLSMFFSSERAALNALAAAVLAAGPREAVKVLATLLSVSEEKVVERLSEVRPEARRIVASVVPAIEEVYMGVPAVTEGGET